MLQEIIDWISRKWIATKVNPDRLKMYKNRDGKI